MANRSKSEQCMKPYFMPLRLILLLRAAVLCCCSQLFASAVHALPDIQVNALLPKQAVITVDGQQRILKIGKASPEGITLISADSKKAVFAWQDQQFERTLSTQIASQFSAPSDKQEARIERGNDGHFFTAGHINGKLVHFLVDTGAFSIAMNAAEADRLGINWRNGKRFIAGTAGGGTPSYEIVIEAVTVGSITMHNVQGAVIVADSMPDILLGMSFLSRTEMKEENNTLVLRKKY